MRNWNQAYYRAKIHKIKGFYSTYEELKQQFADTYLSIESGFYSTYEELKQDCWLFLIWRVFGFLQYLWGIETCVRTSDRMLES